MSNEQIAITIAGLSLLVSLLSAIWAFVAQRKAGKLSEGNLELVLAERVSKTRETELEVSIRIAEIAKDKKKKTDALTKAYESAREDNLNAFDEACGLYLDSKIDKGRFKKRYHRDIQRIVENKVNRSKFDANTSDYKAILKVYREWYDLEK